MSSSNQNIKKKPWCTTWLKSHLHFKFFPNLLNSMSLGLMAEEPLCLAGCDRWLVLIHCERKLLLVAGSWYWFDLMWEKNTKKPPRVSTEKGPKGQNSWQCHHRAFFHFYILKKFKNICQIGKFSKMGACRPSSGRQDLNVKKVYI